MKKLKLILVFLCFSLFGYGQFVGYVYSENDTILFGEVDTVYFLDFLGNPNPACIQYWMLDGVPISNTIGVDSLFITPSQTSTYTAVYINDIGQTLQASVEVVVIQTTSIKEHLRNKDFCEVYDISGRLLHSGAPILLKGLCIYVFYENNIRTVKKIYH